MTPVALCAHPPTIQLRLYTCSICKDRLHLHTRQQRQAPFAYQHACLCIPPSLSLLPVLSLHTRMPVLYFLCLVATKALRDRETLSHDPKAHTLSHAPAHSPRARQFMISLRSLTTFLCIRAFMFSCHTCTRHVLLPHLCTATLVHVMPRCRPRNPKTFATLVDKRINTSRCSTHTKTLLSTRRAAHG